MTDEDVTSGGPPARDRVARAPRALYVGVVAWFVLGVLQLVVATGTWPGREPDPSIESLRSEMGSEVVVPGGPGWPDVLGVLLGAGLLAGAVLLLLGHRWTRLALPVAGIVVIVTLSAVGRAGVAVGLGLFVIATVATMTVVVHRHLSAGRSPAAP